MLMTIFKQTHLFIGLVIGVGLLSACEKGAGGSDMSHAEFLNSNQSAVLKQWMKDNDFTESQFTFNEQAHQGAYSVIIANAQVVALKSKGVRSADHLASLSTLRQLELSFFETVQFSQCPPQLETLKIKGLPAKNLSLEFLEQCPGLTELELLHTNLKDWQALGSLNQLQKLSIKFSDLSHFNLEQALPELRRLDLSNNKISSLSLAATPKQLKQLFLSNNQLSVLPDLSSLTVVETLSLDNNPLFELTASHLPPQLKNLDVRNTSLLGFKALLSVDHLQRVQVQRQPKNLPQELKDKVIAAVSDDSQLAIAEDLMQKHLAVNHLIEKLPKSVNGKALGLSKESTQHFSMSGTTKLSGNITIDELQGLMRIPLAQTDNQLYMQRQVSITGQASVSTGVFRIYSPVDLDFWSMAAVFVDHPQPDAPASSDLQLTGFIVYEAQADKPVAFKVNLIPMADRYLLLIGSDSATGININYQ